MDLRLKSHKWVWSFNNISLTICDRLIMNKTNYEIELKPFHVNYDIVLKFPTETRENWLLVIMNKTKIKRRFIVRLHIKLLKHVNQFSNKKMVPKTKPHTHIYGDWKNLGTKYTCTTFLNIGAQPSLCNPVRAQWARASLIKV